MISRSVLTNRKSRVFLLENGLAVRFPENGKMREHFSRVKDGVLVAVQRRDAGRAQHENVQAISPVADEVVCVKKTEKCEQKIVVGSFPAAFGTVRRPAELRILPPFPARLESKT